MTQKTQLTALGLPGQVQSFSSGRSQKTAYSALGMPGRVRAFTAPFSDGNFTYSNDVDVVVESSFLVEVPTYEVVGDVDVVVGSSFIVEPEQSVVMDVDVVIEDVSLVTVATAVPFLVKALVTIDGVPVSDRLQDVVNIVRGENRAATFSFVISDFVSKPASFLGNDVEITFQLADENGDTVSSSVKIIGVIDSATQRQSDKAIALSGTDKLGAHRNTGNYISEAVTPVLTGSISLSAAGTFATGFSPIWGVQYTGSDTEVVDGQDYFVDTLLGNITVPISSNFLNTPGDLTFEYGVYFPTAQALIEHVVGRKGWVLQLDGVAIADYSAVSKQPVLSITNESALDVGRKLAEPSGVKFEGNLFPNLRAYSEYVNITGPDNHILDESMYYSGADGSGPPLVLSSSIKSALTEQTISSVAKTFSSISVSESSEVLNTSGTVAIEIILDVTTWSLVLPVFVPKALVEIRISKSNVAAVTWVASGSFEYFGATIDIQESDWVQSFEGGDIVLRLSSLPVAAILSFGFRFVVGYPNMAWALVVSTEDISYGEGAVEQTVSVKQVRPIAGVSEALVGDVIEHPYVETAAQGANLGNAVLTRRGNIGMMSCGIPAHKDPGMEIGDKINIKTNGVTKFTGVIDQLAYSHNTHTAETPIHILASGLVI